MAIFVLVARLPTRRMRTSHTLRQWMRASSRVLVPSSVMRCLLPQRAHPLLHRRLRRCLQASLASAHTSSLRLRPMPEAHSDATLRACLCRQTSRPIPPHLDAATTPCAVGMDDARRYQASRAVPFHLRHLKQPPPLLLDSRGLLLRPLQVSVLLKGCTSCVGRRMLLMYRVETLRRRVQAASALRYARALHSTPHQAALQDCSTHIAIRPHASVTKCTRDHRHRDGSMRVL